MDVGGQSDQDSAEASKLSRDLAAQLDLQIVRLSKIRQSKVESLLKVKAGPAEVAEVLPSLM